MKPSARSVNRSSAAFSAVARLAVSGKLFRAYLKPVDNCAACGEAMHHHRADDLPPYNSPYELTIVIVGHVIIAGYMMTDLIWPMPLWLTFAIWTPLTLLATLLIIQPIKGGASGCNGR